ncbi:MAG: SH3 domain-containing protein, partial [Clostridiaceae bacterium]|nr:SH3 domain-containing protein [Clostridiaceae bacterium]
SQRIVYVTGIDATSSLNLRELPDYLSEILTRLYYGQELLVLQTLENGWLQVKTDVMSGYVRQEFVCEKGLANQ